MAIKARGMNLLLVSFDDAVAPWPYRSAFREPLRTPCLDEICAVSTAFHAAYCTATVCNPARASLLSGQTTHQLGVHSNRDDVFAKHDPRIMWPYRLREAGYFCSSGGKVHHGHAPLPGDVHRVLYSDEQKDFVYLPNRAIETTQLGGYKSGPTTLHASDDDVFYDTRSAESACSFLETYDGDAPFYREVGFHSPHTPFAAPLRFREMYRLGRLTQPADWEDGYDSNPYADQRFPKAKGLRRDRLRWWKKSVLNYFSAYSFGDDQLGRVWRALKQSRHADDTIVIIMADHGFHLGNKDRLSKSTLWEQVAHVPLVVHVPGLAARVVDDPVSMIDIGPTVLDLLNLGTITESVGRSLRPYLEGGLRAVAPVPTFFERNASLRYGDMRIIRYEDGSTQFYDLRKDVWQLRDLGRDHPDFDAAYAALVSTCAAWGLQIAE